MRAALFVAVVALVGCGGGNEANFAGTWSGALVDAVTCSDGSSANNPDNGALTIAQTGANLTISTGGHCSGETAVISGQVAAVSKFVCSPFANLAGGTTTDTITAGTLTLSGSSMAMSISMTSVVTSSSGASANCQETDTGTLTRQ